MDAFTRQSGTKQGRIAPAGATPAQGSYVFCLGFDTPGHVEEISEGQFVEVWQDIDFEAATKLLRVNVQIRPPASVPSGLKWRVSLRVANIERAAQDLTPGGPLRSRSFSANVSKLSAGAHRVAIRLQLVSTNPLTQYIHATGVASSAAFGSPTVTV